MPTILTAADARTLTADGLVVADPTGNIVASSPGVFVTFDASAIPIVVRLESSRACSFERLDHYAELTIDVGVAQHIPIHGAGFDETARVRFGDPVLITYPGGVPGLTVKATRLLGYKGFGHDRDVPPPLGANPMSVPIFDKETPVVHQPLVADGAILDNSTTTQLWIMNTSTEQRSIFLAAARRCSFGFFDDEEIVLPAETHLVSKTIPRTRFGTSVPITSANVDGLQIAAVRQEAFIG